MLGAALISRVTPVLNVLEVTADGFREDSRASLPTSKRVTFVVVQASIIAKPNDIMLW
jgi:hypothetical protein